MAISSQLGPLEQEIMDIVWRQKTVTVREVVSVLQRKRKIAYTTVMTIMARLTQKGYLSQLKEGKTYLYKPKQNQQQTLRTLVQQTLSAFIDRFGEEAVVAFVEEADRFGDTNPDKKK